MSDLLTAEVVRLVFVRSVLRQKLTVKVFTATSTGLKTVAAVTGVEVTRVVLELR